MTEGPEPRETDSYGSYDDDWPEEAADEVS